MKVGIPKEIKTREGRVAVTPSGVRSLAARGHEVYIEAKAGTGSGIPDIDYESAGARILASAEEVWAEADLIVKVKEPIGEEFGRMRKGQVLFTYLHLAADEELTRKLLERGVSGIAYETVQLDDGSLPLLAPMSEVAGRLSVQMGCQALEAKNGGRGVLLSGVPGVMPAEVVIIGGGISGLNAAHLAVGMGARVVIIDINIHRLRYLEDVFHSRAATLVSNETNIAECVRGADLVIGSVLVPGARAPKLVTGHMVKNMKKGAAIVDIAIDQGGCFETSRATTHDEPMYAVDGVVHYCVANMPGAVPRTSTWALTNATLPYICELADKGLEKALAGNGPLARGLNVHRGSVVHERVAEAFGMSCHEFKSA